MPRNKSKKTKVVKGTSPPKGKASTVRKARGKISFQSPRGMHDILPSDWRILSKFYNKASDILEFYGFARIETPIAEEKDLFVRSVGEHTDIVEKEMYAVKSKGREDLVLRPEITAPVVRSYMEHGMSRLPQPQKLYYISQVFRHEKPQAGRFRQFWQIGAEILGGESDPVYDAQIILAAYKIVEELKLGELMVGINSIGGVNDRQNYKKKLVDYYKKYSKEICKDCTRRLKTNPLRVLDCKVKGCQEIKENAPIILDNLSGASKAHFKQVLEFLEEGGIPYVLKPNLVRGLDYYNRTVFEVFLMEEGQEELALLGGGRYDYLAEQLGGKPLSGVGMSIGVERVAAAIKDKHPDFGSPRGRKEVFLVHVGQLAKKRSVSLLEEFRKDGLNIVSNLGKSSLSAQLEAANKAEVPLALILGQKEVFEESIIIRDMRSGTQETVPLSKVVKELKKKL
ncbi:MAG: histidine--tRNA ligase [Candidatus Colwellbacteria bacterium]